MFPTVLWLSPVAKTSSSGYICYRISLVFRCLLKLVKFLNCFVGRLCLCVTSALNFCNCIDDVSHFSFLNEKHSLRLAATHLCLNSVLKYLIIRFKIHLLFVRAVGNFCQFSSQKIDFFLNFHSFSVTHDVVQKSPSKSDH